MKRQVIRMREFRRCTVCDKLYIATRANAKYCSATCREKGTTELKAIYRKQQSVDKPKRKKKQSVTEIAVAARKAGMTYGQYVAKMEYGMVVEQMGE